MKIAVITVGLLATAMSQASPAFARGTLHLLAPSQHAKPDQGAQPACDEHGRHRRGKAQNAKWHIPSACPQERTLWPHASGDSQARSVGGRQWDGFARG